MRPLGSANENYAKLQNWKLKWNPWQNRGSKILHFHAVFSRKLVFVIRVPLPHENPECAADHVRCSIRSHSKLILTDTYCFRHSRVLLINQSDFSTSA